jgi:hypothetical protein
MSRILIKSVLILALATLLVADEPYKLIIHNTDPNAKCLDGSSPGVYFHQGAEKNNFLIYFVGGGYCTGTTFN